MLTPEQGSRNDPPKTSARPAKQMTSAADARLSVEFPMRGDYERARPRALAACEILSFAYGVFGNFRTANDLYIKVRQKLGETPEPKKVSTYEPVPEKTSVDLFIGQSIGIDRRHADYYPLMLGIFILGGTFSSRLMTRVRDEQGLTYGTYSRIEGVDDGVDGYWYAWGTFSPLLLKKGEQAMLKELKLLADKGVTKAELDAKKATIRGSYAVGLATTGGLAETVLTNAEQGRPTEFLDQFLTIIDNVSLSQVNTAIKKYLNPRTLAAIAAGSVTKTGAPMKVVEG